jgi:hypothetical protein
LNCSSALADGRRPTRIGGEGEQRSLARRAGDRPELGGRERVVAHQLELVALIGRLTHDQTRFRVIAAVIDEFGAGRLQLADERAVVLLAGVDALEHHFLDAELVERVLDDRRQAFAVGALVVDDGDLLAGEVLGDPRRDEGALRVVAREVAHDRRIALLGQRRVGRRRAHHQHLVVGCRRRKPESTSPSRRGRRRT